MSPTYKPYKKAGFLAPVNDIHHLYAVMNDTCADGQCLIVNITSIKPGRYHDQSCVLDVGDHPFIRNPSYILYRRAETAPAARIGRHMDIKLYIRKEDWRDAVFQRIVDGLHLSEDVELRIVRYAMENNII